VFRRPNHPLLNAATQKTCFTTTQEFTFITAPSPGSSMLHPNVSNITCPNTSHQPRCLALRPNHAETHNPFIITSRLVHVRMFPTLTTTHRSSSTLPLTHQSYLLQEEQAPQGRSIPVFIFILAPPTHFDVGTVPPSDQDGVVTRKKRHAYLRICLAIEQTSFL